MSALQWIPYMQALWIYITHVEYGAQKESVANRIMHLFHRIFYFLEYDIKLNVLLKRMKCHIALIVSISYQFEFFKHLQAYAFKSNICIYNEDISNSRDGSNHVFLQLSYATQSMKDSALCT